METTSLLDENWTVLLSLFPANWRELAKDTGAMVRRFRNFSSEDAVIRTLLIHIAQGYSLRETIEKAKAAGIADISDVSLLKRLRCSENWLKALCQALFTERGLHIPTTTNGIKMRLVDATNVKEPGKTGSLWRIHYSIRLPELRCDYFKLTPAKGKATGETYTQFSAQKNDCIIGDRGYSTAPGIEHLNNVDAYTLVRVNSIGLIFYSKSGNKLSILDNVEKLQANGQMGEWEVQTKTVDGSFISGRICAIRKSEYAIERAIKKLKRDACKKQHKLKPETIEFAKYVIVFTTLPSKDFSLSSILEWYRLRWQVELIFKRLKSLAGLGHLPKYDEASSRAWLYGKLFVGLLVDKLIEHANNISPWGYRLGYNQGKK